MLSKKFEAFKKKELKNFKSQVKWMEIMFYPILILIIISEFTEYLLRLYYDDDSDDVWAIYFVEFWIAFCFLFQFVIYMNALCRMFRLQASSDSTKTSNTKMISIHFLSELFMIINEVVLFIAYCKGGESYKFWVIFGYISVVISFLTQICLIFVVNSLRLSVVNRKQIRKQNRMSRRGYRLSNESIDQN